MQVSKQISLGVLGFILFIALTFGLDYSGMLWNSFIGPKKEQVRREIFEQTKSYSQGMIMQLIDYRKQYKLAKDPGDKAIIAETVSHMFSDFNSSNLDTELKTFVNECKYNQ